MHARPAFTRYPTAGERTECSTGNTSNVIPQIFVGVRSLITWRSLIGKCLNSCHVFSGAYTGHGRALFQSPGVIGMRVREHDRPGVDAFQFSQPIKTAIDHHFALRYETSSDVCIRCRRVRASISPRVPKNVRFTRRKYVSPYQKPCHVEQALQRNAKHEARLSKISGPFCSLPVIMIRDSSLRSE
jgi:hypothetical protein